MADGLNIATREGTGQAHILNLEPFHNTLKEIYQRDIERQKSYRDQYERSSLEAAHLANGIRPVDLPKFTEYADEFKKAKLMSMNPSVQKDPKQFAYWTDRANQSFVSAMNHANQSKQAVIRGNFYDKERVVKKGAGFLEDYDHRRSLYDSTPVDQMSKLGMDQQGFFIAPPDTYKELEFNKKVFGDKPTSISLTEQKEEGGTKFDVTRKYTAPSNLVQLKDEKGNPTGKYDYSEVMHQTANFLKGNYHVNSIKQDEYNNTSPEQRIATYKEAARISDGQFSPFSDDYVNLAVARNIIKANPVLVGEQKKEVKLTEPQKEQKQIEKEQRAFKRQLTLIDLRSKNSMRNFYAKQEFNLSKDQGDTLGDLVGEAFKSGQTGKYAQPGKKDQDYAIVPLTKGKKNITIPVTTEKTKQDGVTKYTETKEVQPDAIIALEDGSFKAVRWATEGGKKLHKFSEEVDLTPRQVATLAASETSTIKNIGSKVKQLLTPKKKDQSKDPLSLY